MRYESIPKRVLSSLSTLFNYLKGEFGIWTYAFIIILCLALYKPVFWLFNVISGFILYAFLAVIGLGILYWLIKKIFK